MSRRIWVLLLVLMLAFSLFISGCFYPKAMKAINGAERALSDLKAQGGEKLVPYEYCSAERYLENAKLEAGESDWSHARSFADRSRAASEAGLSQIQKRK